MKPLTPNQVRQQTADLAEQLRQTDEPAVLKKFLTKLVPLLIAYWDVHPHSAMEMLKVTVDNLTVSLAKPLVKRVVLGWQKRPGYSPDAGGNADHCFLAALLYSDNYHLAEPKWAERVLPRLSTKAHLGTKDEERKLELFQIAASRQFLSFEALRSHFET